MNNHTHMFNNCTHMYLTSQLVCTVHPSMHGIIQSSWEYMHVHISKLFCIIAFYSESNIGNYFRYVFRDNPTWIRL